MIIQVTDDGGLEGWSNGDDENENTCYVFDDRGNRENDNSLFVLNK